MTDAQRRIVKAIADNVEAAEIDTLAAKIEQFGREMWHQCQTCSGMKHDSHCDGPCDYCWQTGIAALEAEE